MKLSKEEIKKIAQDIKDRTLDNIGETIGEEINPFELDDLDGTFEEIRKELKKIL